MRIPRPGERVRSCVGWTVFRFTIGGAVRPPDGAYDARPVGARCIGADPRSAFRTVPRSPRALIRASQATPVTNVTPRVAHRRRRSLHCPHDFADPLPRLRSRYSRKGNGFRGAKRRRPPLE
ncbi:hypothetical protein GCM10023353_02680 [Tomitella cavernea]|uniref:Uncharacterized protein n=1 Tax=Tomitella cavernea TaxID=1387982 RepID=A0ABP9C6Y1_9ACTN